MKMNKVLPNGQRAKAAQIFIGIVTGLTVLSIVSNLLQYNLLSNIYNVSFKEADANDLRQIVVAALIFIAFIGGAITYIMWSRRAYHNLHKAGVKGLRYSEGWAAGAWFVPFFNFVGPFMITKEIINSTMDSVKGEIEDNGQRTKLNTFFVIWWVTYLLSGIIERVAASKLNTTNISSMQEGTIISIVSDAMTIISGVTIIYIIREMRKVEERFYLKCQEGENTGSVYSISESDEILD